MKKITMIAITLLADFIFAMGTQDIQIIESPKINISRNIYNNNYPREIIGTKSFDELISCDSDMDTVCKSFGFSSSTAHDCEILAYGTIANAVDSTIDLIENTVDRFQLALEYGLDNNIKQQWGPSLEVFLVDVQDKGNILIPYGLYSAYQKAVMEHLDTRDSGSFISKISCQ